MYACLEKGKLILYDYRIFQNMLYKLVIFKMFEICCPQFEDIRYLLLLFKFFIHTKVKKKNSVWRTRKCLVNLNSWSTDTNLSRKSHFFSIAEHSGFKKNSYWHHINYSRCLNRLKELTKRNCSFSGLNPKSRYLSSKLYTNFEPSQITQGQ